jgi:hypothetical protein
LLNDISYEAVFNLSGLLSGLYFGVGYVSFLLKDIEGSILIKKRKYNEFGLNISESSHLFAETMVAFATLYTIIVTALVILRIPISLRPTSASPRNTKVTNQCMQILTISATIMALYVSAMPVMLLVKDVAVSIAKRRESTGTTGEVSKSELASLMGCTGLILIIVLVIFSLLIIMSIVITNTVFLSQKKILDEELGGKANTEPLITHNSASIPNIIALSSHSLGGGPGPGIGEGSTNMNTSISDPGAISKPLEGHVNNSPTVSSAVDNSERSIQDVSGSGTKSEEDVPQVESISQREDLQSEGSGSITKRRKSA